MNFGVRTQCIIRNVDIVSESESYKDVKPLSEKKVHMRHESYLYVQSYLLSTCRQYFSTESIKE